MTVDIRATSNAAEITRYFGKVASLAVPRAQESMIAAGGLLKEEIQLRISVEGHGEPSAPGEPPRMQSHDYHDSWQMQPVAGPSEVGVVVGTDTEYARRLEWGFVGTDSLGRSVRQAPRPHVGPAVDLIEPLLGDDLMDKILFTNITKSGITTTLGPPIRGGR